MLCSVASVAARQARETDAFCALITGAVALARVMFVGTCGSCSLVLRLGCCLSRCRLTVLVLQHRVDQGLTLREPGLVVLPLLRRDNLARTYQDGGFEGGLGADRGPRRASILPYSGGRRERRDGRSPKPSRGSESGVKVVERCRRIVRAVPGGRGDCARRGGPRRRRGRAGDAAPMRDTPGECTHNRSSLKRRASSPRRVWRLAK